LNFLEREEALEEEHRQLNERAYFSQLTYLRDTFPGQYVAFVDGKFVDHDEDLTLLSERIEKTEPNRYKRFYAKTDVDYLAKPTIF